MPITVAWDNEEKTIVRVTYSGRWTWEEAYTIPAKIRTLIAGLDYEVATIHDMRDANFLPSGAITHTRDILSKPLDKVGLVVLIGNSRFIEAMYQIFKKLYPRIVEQMNFRLVMTEAEAYRLIESARSVHNS